MKLIKKIFWALLYSTGAAGLALTFAFNITGAKLLETISFYFYGGCFSLGVILILGMAYNMILSASNKRK